MKSFDLIHVLLFFIEVDSKFLVLLHHLKMKNPVIVGKISDLMNKEMIQLFKDVNLSNQSISMTAKLQNGSHKTSSGIMLYTDNLSLKAFYFQNVSFVNYKGQFFIC